jgi:hypothetical protein
MRALALVTTHLGSMDTSTVELSGCVVGLRNTQGTVLPAVLMTCAAIFFGATIVTAALVYSRARRRGMSPAEQAYQLESSRLVDDDDV